jgi:CubicO group peptidase (beta-lactamase class C family)
MKRLLIVISLISIMSFECKPNFSKVAEIMRKSVADHAFPGGTIAVGNDKEVVWSEAFGNQDYTHLQAVTPNTLYDLASLTKVIGTTSVYMKLVEAEKINVKHPVREYLPDFIDKAPTPHDKELRHNITIENLLTHTGGFFADKPFWKYPSVKGYKTLIDEILKTPLENPPNTKFVYSDISMMIAGEVASHVGNKPLDQLEQELVFRPLMMNDTLRNPPKSLWYRVPPTEKVPDTNDTYIHGFVHDENARAGQGITGHAGLFSTTLDLSVFATQILLGLQGKGKLFSNAVLEQFVSQSKVIPNLGRTLGWAFDDQGTSEKPDRYIHHTGFTGTSIRIYLDRKLYIILLTNRVHPTRENTEIIKVRLEVADAVLKAVSGN